MTSYDEKVAILALTLVVRRLAQRAARNHPRAFEGLLEDVHECGELTTEERKALLMQIGHLVSHRLVS